MEVAAVDPLEADAQVAAHRPVLRPGRRLVALALLVLVDRLAPVEVLVLLLREDALLAHRLEHLRRGRRRRGRVADLVGVDPGRLRRVVRAGAPRDREQQHREQRGAPAPPRPSSPTVHPPHLGSPRLRSRPSPGTGAAAQTRCPGSRSSGSPGRPLLAGARRACRGGSRAAPGRSPAGRPSRRCGPSP